MDRKRILRIWRAMKQRCYNPDSIGWKYYGGKGITICDEWLNSFDTFCSWALDNGYNDHLTIDRIDSSLGYNPDNCRWITIQDQQRNRSNNRLFTYNGQTKLVTQWAKEYNTNYKLILERVDLLGWSFEDALLAPPDHGKMISFNGQTKTIKEWAECTGLSYNTIKNRINHLGWSAEDALTAAPKSIYNHNKSFDTFIEYNGITKSLADWSRELGIPAETIRGRLKRGWPVNIVLSKNANGYNKKQNVMIEYKSETKTLSEWAKELGVKPQFLYDRIYVLGWDIEKAFTTPSKAKSKTAVV